jgi:hypothetical protein
MPLHVDIDALALGELTFAGRHYLFLEEPVDGRFVAAARYERHPQYLECTHLVSDGYGPTMFVLLMQKARRDGLLGVAPDLRYNSAEAKHMDERFYSDPPSGVRHLGNSDATHAEPYLNQIYFVDTDLIGESSARERFRSTGFGPAADPAAALVAALVDRLEAYLFKSELPYK